MEIRSNNYYQQSPAFKRVVIPKESQKRFMRALREECSPTDLLKVLQVIEKEATNTKNNIVIRDLGYLFGMPCNGHWEATVAGNTYNNCSSFLFPAKPPKFLKMLSDKAEKGLSKEEQLARLAKDKANEIEIAKKITRFKDGAITEAERKSYLCGQIFDLIR